MAPLSHSIKTDSSPNPDLTVNPDKILLVEDDPTNQAVLHALLNRLGCQVEVANSGEEALSKLAELTYDIVLMDCCLPDIKGWEVTRVLRKLEPEDSRTVVIALTALVAEDDRNKCLEAGMDCYLSKPVKLKDLAQALKIWSPSNQSLSVPGSAVASV